MVESATPGRSILQPAIHGISGNLLDSGNRRFAHSLDTQSGDLIERSSAMLKAIIDCTPVPAEGSAAHFASEPTAFTPAGWIETKTNDPSQRGFCSQEKLCVWTAETLHGVWTRSSAELATS
jgi:hypothetical protein